MLCCPEIGIVNKNVGQKFRQMFFRGVIHLLQIDMYLSKKQLFFRKKKGNEVIMGSVKNKICFAKMSNMLSGHYCPEGMNVYKQKKIDLGACWR